MTSTKSFKVTVVGDRGVGKTTLILTCKNDSLSEYVPAYDCCAMDSNYDQDYQLTLCDTPSNADYERLRPLLNYEDTNCFLLCYSVVDRTSFENAASKWYPEIRHFSPDVPIVLVGTKSDIRLMDPVEFVTTDDGRKLNDKINANAFVECSAKEQLNVDVIFLKAIQAIECKPVDKAKRCEIM